MVIISVGGQPIDFLVDTGTAYSVLQNPLGHFISQTIKIQGTMGDVKQYKYTTDWRVNLGQGTVTHFFIVIPKCSSPLLR